MIQYDKILKNRVMVWKLRFSVSTKSRKGVDSMSTYEVITLIISSNILLITLLNYINNKK